MKGDLHVRFCENTEVKFFCVTRLAANYLDNTIDIFVSKFDNH